MLKQYVVSWINKKNGLSFVYIKAKSASEAVIQFHDKYPDKIINNIFISIGL